MIFFCLERHHILNMLKGYLILNIENKHTMQWQPNDASDIVLRILGNRTW